MVEIRSAYGPRVRVSVSFDPDRGLTRQSFRDECDVNAIMAKYAKSGMVDHVSRLQGRYGDFSDAPTDYLDAMQTVLDAREAFLGLPAKVRKEFDNDPGEFLAFMSDPSNEDRVRELGLLPPKAPDRAKNASGDDQASTPAELPTPSL